MGLDHVSEFKYLGCVLDESGTEGAECHRKAANGRRIAVTIRSLANANNLQLECGRVLPVLTYNNDNNTEGGEV